MPVIIQNDFSMSSITASLMPSIQNTTCGKTKEEFWGKARSTAVLEDAYWAYKFIQRLQYATRHRKSLRHARDISWATNIRQNRNFSLFEESAH